MEVIIETLLNRLLATSVQTALLAAVVWLICRFVPRLSPATQCWLWWLVALQVLLGLCMDPLLLPLLPHAPAAVPVLVPVLEVNPLVADGAVSMASTASRGSSFWQSSVFVLWAGGFAVMAWSTLRHWQHGRELRSNSAQCMDERVLRAVEQAAESCGLRRAPQLRMTRSIDSPMVVGPLHPVLLLPAEATLSSEELEMAVAHELEHLRRADLWWGFMPALARQCFFFHPLVHLAVREYGIAREAACDAAVVDAGQRSRREYGELLLRLGTAESGSGLAAASPTFKALSRRLMLLQQGAFLPRAGSIAVLLLVVVGVMPMRLVAAVAKPLGLPERVVSESFAAVPAQPAGPVRVAAQSTRVAAQSPAPAGMPEAKPGYSFRPDVDDYYPAASRRAGEQGVVKLRLCYDEKGKVTESTVATSSGFPGLDSAAVKVGKATRIHPGLKGDTPQADCLIMPVQFSLKLQKVAAVQSGANPQAPPVAESAADPAISRLAYVFRPDVNDYYPAASRSAGEEGVVKLHLCYDENGKVTESTVPESSGFARLDEAAVRMGRLFRFKPGAVNGQPQPGCVTAPVRFSLTSQTAETSQPTYTGERMTVNFQDISIGRFLQLLSEVSGRDILVDQSVTGSITMNVNNVPWDQVLDIVLRTKGLEKRLEGNAIVISAAPVLPARQSATANPITSLTREDMYRLGILNIADELKQGDRGR